MGTVLCEASYMVTKDVVEGNVNPLLSCPLCRLRMGRLQTLSTMLYLQLTTSIDQTMGVFSIFSPYNGGWSGWPLPLVALDGLLHFLLDWWSSQTLTSKLKLEELLVSYTQLGRIKAWLYVTELD